jgi:hypothetical protein
MAFLVCHRVQECRVGGGFVGGGFHGAYVVGVFDVLLMYLHMPLMGGLGVYVRSHQSCMHTLPPCCSLIIVLLLLLTLLLLLLQ